MRHSQESYLALVEQAYAGSLQLPAFQRDWSWSTTQVFSLYDSLRKQFPVGGFLLIDHSEDIPLAPRLFHGVPISDTAPMRLVLDGQQRITAGVTLLYAPDKLRYFLDLERLHEEFVEQERDLSCREDIRQFSQDLDDGDHYLKTSKRTATDETLLLEKHFLSTRHLGNTGDLQRALEAYEATFPERGDFLKYVIVPFFAFPETNLCPVVTLDEKESLTAVTRVFTTLNTTGKRLTSLEIVTAILFASDINLREMWDVYEGSSPYLSNMGRSSGEVVLQGVALLANKSPKKSLLPKTITAELFREYLETALSLLDQVGKFLTDRLGVGLSHSGKLLPYDSILAPMAAVLHRVGWETLDGPQKAKADKCLESWFVCSSLSQRYQEGVHNKQTADTDDVTKWINTEGDEHKPAWMRSVGVGPDLLEDSPKGAVGRLLRCLMNRSRPKDPIDGTLIGSYEGAHELSHDHHIWPKRFCKDNLPGWNPDVAKADVALNVMPVSKATNQRWSSDDPAHQIAAAEDSRSTSEVLESYGAVFVTQECLDIMRKPEKRQSDYVEFLELRKGAFAKEMRKWGVAQFTDENE